MEPDPMTLQSNAANHRRAHLAISPRVRRGLTHALSAFSAVDVCRQIPGGYAARMNGPYQKRALWFPMNHLFASDPTPTPSELPYSGSSDCIPFANSSSLAKA